MILSLSCNNKEVYYEQTSSSRIVLNMAGVSRRNTVIVILNDAVLELMQDGNTYKLMKTPNIVDDYLPLVVSEID